MTNERENPAIAGTAVFASLGNGIYIKRPEESKETIVSESLSVDVSPS